MKFDIGLNNTRIITHNGELLTGKYIYIKDGMIAKISDVPLDKAKEEIDCSSYFVSPGLVNLHAHSPMHMFRGIAEDVNPDTWFNEEIWPYESKIEEEDVYYGSMLAILEMLDHGVTAFADHYFHAEMVAKATLDTGIRGDIAPTIFGLTDNFDGQVEQVSQLIETYNGTHSRLQMRMGPHSPYTCTDKQLKKIIDRAKALNVGMHIHVSETEAQVKDCPYAETPIQLLAELGGFDIPAILGHALWIQEEDLKYINDHVTIAVCPKTYMKLGMGYGNIWKYYKTLPLAIGTDGAASSNTIRPVEQAMFFGLIGKFMTSNPEMYTVKDLWKMLMKGHDALSFNSGRVEEGYAADLVVWNLGSVQTMPVYNPITTILYSSNANNVYHSIIDGKIVKRSGQLNINQEEILKEVKGRAIDIMRRGKGGTKLVF